MQAPPAAAPRIPPAAALKTLGEVKLVKSRELMISSFHSFLNCLFVDCFCLLTCPKESYPVSANAGILLTNCLSLGLQCFSHDCWVILQVLEGVVHFCSDQTKPSWLDIIYLLNSLPKNIFVRQRYSISIPFVPPAIGISEYIDKQLVSVFDLIDENGMDPARPSRIISWYLYDCMQMCGCVCPSLKKLHQRMNSIKQS